MLRRGFAKALINIRGCAEQEAYRPAKKQIKFGRQGKTFGGAPNKRRTDPKEKEADFFDYNNGVKELLRLHRGDHLRDEGDHLRDEHG